MHTLTFLAGLRGVAAAELARVIEANAARVFGLP
jgi:Tat protein secretion system quality control protein TatD with DNase activity